MSEPSVTLHSLHVHPVKSCAGIALSDALVVETGLEFDRAWMVVDGEGEFLSQREAPRLQLVRPAFRNGELMLRAPGMLALHLRLDAAEAACRVRVWDDVLMACDMGDLAAQWFSDYLSRPLRLARFDPQQRRLASRRWTGDIEAENLFSDAFPLLVVSTASLGELNRRLAARGQPAVTMERFRPNLVLDGLDPHGEDFLDELCFETPEGPVRLKLVKPCSRCTVPNVDPQSAATGPEPGDTLATYRADPRVDGAITFGMNGIVLEGVDRTLRTGMRVHASVAF
jgi:uncharacterized protein YcbX